jgi:hypothetical protein
MDIDELHTNYRGLDKAEVIKEGDSVNFTDVKNEIERIYQWENDYYEAADYRTQLPEENRKSIENEFATILSQLKEIAQLRANDISSLAQRRADIANSIRNLYRTIYGVFVQDYRGWRVENQGARYTQELEDIVKQAQSAQEKISAQESTAKVETSRIQRRSKASSVATQAIGLSELAKYFYQLVRGDNEWMSTDKKKPNRLKRSTFWVLRRLRGYEGASKLWLFSALIATVLTTWFAYHLLSPFIHELTESNKYTGKTASFIFAVLIAKAIILLAPLYIIRFFVKNYGANKHLSADALHKAKTLQTLSAFLEVAQNDKVAIRSISTVVATQVFTNKDSGFIVQKGDISFPDVNVNAPIRPT